MFKEFFQLLKKGNKSALLAFSVNGIIGSIKAGAAALTGNVAMFAETLHSFGDSANQLFVYIGSALSKKSPTDRFPHGFGRLVNLVLLGAVIIVGIMSYEAIKEGIHHMFHPSESQGLWINVSVLTISVLLESFVLWKAMKEVVHETGADAKGLAVIPASFTHFGKAKPATRLVVLEDTVATVGGLLALIAIFISHFTPFQKAEGLASVIIGLLMFVVVGKVFMDNAAGVLGQADEEMEQKLGDIAMKVPGVTDVKEVIVTEEGEHYHVEMELEAHRNMTLAEAVDIKEKIEADILSSQKGITDISIEFQEDDHVKTWKQQDDNQPSS